MKRKTKEEARKNLAAASALTLKKRKTKKDPRKNLTAAASALTLKKRADLSPQGALFFTAVIERDGEWYIAFCPEIPEANGQGKTKEEARKSLADGIALLFEDRREDGLRNLSPGAIRRPFKGELLRVILS